MTPIELMMSGAIAVGASIASLFFLRFMRHTRDPFFRYFALAFLLQALAAIAAALQLPFGGEAMPYVSRLLSYVLIVLAIWIKNRRPMNRQ